MIDATPTGKVFRNSKSPIAAGSTSKSDGAAAAAERMTVLKRLTTPNSVNSAQRPMNMPPALLNG
ncbi:hypothetical protein D3C72_1806090 [compost metagenome]